MSFEIWIPAHNEEKVIVKTIASLQLVTKGKSNVFIGVACNGCTDQTEELSRQEGVSVHSWPALGKWKTIEQIVFQSQSEWIGFVDAGTVWGSNVWSKDFEANLSDPEVMGFTLEYAAQNMNWLEKIYWMIESAMKTFEEKMGGLVTVSGFSMFFRREELLKAIRFLRSEFGEVSWLNDDVILPLCLRFLFPHKKIKLVKSTLQKTFNIVDLGLDSVGQEKKRRLRMMRGNLQWIRRMVPRFFEKRFFSFQRTLVLLLLSRKILKVFWSYLFISLMLALACKFVASTFLLPIFFLLMPKVGSAFLASIKAPFELFAEEPANLGW